MPYLLQHPVTSLGDAPSSLESVDDSLVVQVRNNTNLSPGNTKNLIFIFEFPCRKPISINRSHRTRRKRKSR